MLGEKLWVDLAVPTGKKICPDVLGQGSGVWRDQFSHGSGWLPQEMLWKPEES